MNAISRREDVCPDRRLRFPALPVADSAGTSFKHEHLNAILAESPQAGFLEVHAENYMGAGRPPHQALERIRRDHPVSLHGVCMSIGGRTGCGLLLDVNNVFVSATNHGYAALDYLSDFPLAEVGEIHLAGHAEQSDDEGDRLLIDSHDGPVADAVWKLYEIVISRCGPIPTLIEWDSKIPAWPILRAEAAAAQAILDRFTSPRALGGGHAA
jgi:uncharacterized protein (UPF0276 family)